MVLILTMLTGPVLAKAPGDKADPDKRQPMRVVVVRLADPACEPDCPKWISAEGDITEDTPAEFRRVLKQTAKTPLPIFIQSRGGNVDAAIEIGRMIRKAGLDIAVTQTKFEGCDPGDRTCAPKAGQPYRGRPQSFAAYCYSACPYLIAGGKRRFIPALTRVGVHQVEMTHVNYRDVYRIEYQMVDGRKKEISRTFLRRETVSKTKEAPDPNSETYRKIDAYLQQMDVSAEVRSYALLARHDEIRMLSQAELRETGLQTDAVPGELLVNKSYLAATKDAPPQQALAVRRDPEPKDARTVGGQPPDVAVPFPSPPGGAKPVPFSGIGISPNPGQGLAPAPSTQLQARRGRELQAAVKFDLSETASEPRLLLIDFAFQPGEPFVWWKALVLKNGAVTTNEITGVTLTASAKAIIPETRLQYAEGERFSTSVALDRGLFCDLVSAESSQISVLLGSEDESVPPSRTAIVDKITWLDTRLLSICPPPERQDTALKTD